MFFIGGVESWEVGGAGNNNRVVICVFRFDMKRKEDGQQQVAVVVAVHRNKISHKENKRKWKET